MRERGQLPQRNQPCWGREGTRTKTRARLRATQNSTRTNKLESLEWVEHRNWRYVARRFFSSNWSQFSSASIWFFTIYQISWLFFDWFGSFFCYLLLFFCYIIIEILSSVTLLEHNCKIHKMNTEINFIQEAPLVYACMLVYLIVQARVRLYMRSYVWLDMIETSINGTIVTFGAALQSNSEKTSILINMVLVQLKCTISVFNKNVVIFISPLFSNWLNLDIRK